ncbi:MAG: hypothetical protein KA841_01005, partial [Chitinophagales bacterium]|nr:hypothetical protein [Chitinophagales bacterium]
MKKIFVIASLFFSILSAVAQSAGSMKAVTLQEAVAFALENNNTMKNAQLDQKIAKARNWE